MSTFVKGINLALYVGEKLKIGVDPKASIGFGWIDEDQKLICALAVTGWDGYRQSAFLSVVNEQPKKVTRGMFRKHADILFNELKLRRVTIVVRLDNRRSRRVTEFFGAKPEGILRAADPDGEDSILYGLLREECPWIPQK